MTECSSAAVVARTDRKYFSPEEAGRALPYVARIVRDVRDTYRAALAVQQQIELPRPEDDPRDATERYESLMGLLNGYVDELHQVGVEMKDCEIGLVDFPALHEGREVLLCWKLGEPALQAWHEVDAGFAGRRPIEELTRAARVAE